MRSVASHRRHLCRADLRRLHAQSYLLQCPRRAMRLRCVVIAGLGRAGTLYLLMRRRMVSYRLCPAVATPVVAVLGPRYLHLLVHMCHLCVTRRCAAALAAALLLCLH